MGLREPITPTVTLLTYVGALSPTVVPILVPVLLSMISEPGTRAENREVDVAVADIPGMGVVLRVLPLRARVEGLHCVPLRFGLPEGYSCSP